jgi:hypothetical protein
VNNYWQECDSKLPSPEKVELFPFSVWPYPLDASEAKVLLLYEWESFYDSAVCRDFGQCYGSKDVYYEAYPLWKIERIKKIVGESEVKSAESRALAKLRRRLGDDAYEAFMRRDAAACAGFARQWQDRDYRAHQEKWRNIREGDPLVDGIMRFLEEQLKIGRFGVWERDVLSAFPGYSREDIVAAASRAYVNRLESKNYKHLPPGEPDEWFWALVVGYPCQFACDAFVSERENE